MSESIQTLIDLALSEDIGEGDVTSEYFIPADRMARAMVTARTSGVVSGVELAALVFTTVDSTLEIPQFSATLEWRGHSHCPPRGGGQGHPGAHP